MRKGTLIRLYDTDGFRKQTIAEDGSLWIVQSHDRGHIIATALATGARATLLALDFEEVADDA